MRNVGRLVSVAFVVILGAGLIAQTPELNVKLGLWEMTMTMAMSGMPPMTMKNCMTKEKLQEHTMNGKWPTADCGDVK